MNKRAFLGHIAMLIIDFVGVVRGFCSLNNPTLREALQAKLPLRGVLRGLKQTAGVSLRVLRGSAGATISGGNDPTLRVF